MPIIMCVGIKVQIEKKERERCYDTSEPHATRARLTRMGTYLTLECEHTWVDWKNRRLLYFCPYPSCFDGKGFPGSHQFHLPNNRIVAGTSSVLIIVASTSTATA